MSEIAAGHIFVSLPEIVESLFEKFEDCETPKQIICETDCKQLDIPHDSFKHKEFATDDNSTKFKVKVFTSQSILVKTANHLCTCHLCQYK